MTAFTGANTGSTTNRATSCGDRYEFPHQPRLDWRMRSALGGPSENPWVSRFLRRLLENSPEVTELLGSNPFPHQPPLYVRALLYDYRYSSP